MIRQIRQTPTLADTVIIATSASVFEDDHQQSIAAGSNAFLPKPIDAVLLFEQLQCFLDIEWLYQDEKEEIYEPDEAAEFILPSSDTLQSLLNLARIGDIEELRTKLAELVQNR